jgi:hypothetical protein
MPVLENYYLGVDPVFEMRKRRYFLNYFLQIEVFSQKKSLCISDYAPLSFLTAAVNFGTTSNASPTIP